MGINIEDIINTVPKYHYYISSSTKTVLIGSSNDKKEAKTLALKKLAPNILNLLGKKIILVTIKNTEKKFKNDQNDNLKIIGGPIRFELQNEIIKSNKKIISGDKSKRYVYLSEKYIKKNVDDITNGLKNVVNDYKNNELNCQKGVLCMSIL